MKSLELVRRSAEDLGEPWRLAKKINLMSSLVLRAHRGTDGACVILETGQ